MGMTRLHTADLTVDRVQRIADMHGIVHRRSGEWVVLLDAGTRRYIHGVTLEEQWVSAPKTMNELLSWLGY
jgi:hypothetical protein